ncbi:uncharacterized protein [Phaseolus vulgaris]|uniref:uncharacterized protein n=1 Tax=Phaseolus vulgaris TaxID=3885 RepID=UPI0035CC79C0
MNQREEQGGEQFGEQRDNQNSMSTAMLIQLQREIETLKKSNEEELSMLRAKNAYMKRKFNEETILNTSFETVRPRIHIRQRVHNEERFETTRKKIPETSGIFVGISVRRHPFSEAIIETPLPENWKNFTMEKYDGGTDPDEHIGEALSWFTRLPPLSIDCFNTLVKKFGAHFATSRAHHLTSIALVNMRQEKGESLRTFMERFGKVALSIHNLSPKVTMHHMITALKPGPFADNLCKKTTTNLDELRQRASKFMQMEEFKEFRGRMEMIRR